MVALLEVGDVRRALQQRVKTQRVDHQHVAQRSADWRQEPAAAKADIRDDHPGLERELLGDRQAQTTDKRRDNARLLVATTLASQPPDAPSLDATPAKRDTLAPPGLPGKRRWWAQLCGPDVDHDRPPLAPLRSRHAASLP